MKELKFQHKVNHKNYYSYDNYNPLSTIRLRINWMKSVFKDQHNSKVDIRNNIISSNNFICKGEIVKQFINDCLI